MIDSGKWKIEEQWENIASLDITLYHCAKSYAKFCNLLMCVIY